MEHFMKKRNQNVSEGVDRVRSIKSSMKSHAAEVSVAGSPAKEKKEEPRRSFGEE